MGLEVHEAVLLKTFVMGTLNSLDHKMTDRKRSKARKSRTWKMTDLGTCNLQIVFMFI